MEFLQAQLCHLDDICRITDEAKAQLKSMGLDQWQKGYPSREVWHNDIIHHRAWIAHEDECIIGAFAFETLPDPSYFEIDGQWLTDTPYASMHRVCVADQAKGQGVAARLFHFGFDLARSAALDSLRIDTHPNNTPMLRALDKAGFVPCGTIILKGGSEDGDLRVAFEKIL